MELKIPLLCLLAGTLQGVVGERLLFVPGVSPRLGYSWDQLGLTWKTLSPLPHLVKYSKSDSKQLIPYLKKIARKLQQDMVEKPRISSIL